MGGLVVTVEVGEATTCVVGEAEPEGEPLGVDAPDEGSPRTPDTLSEDELFDGEVAVAPEPDGEFAAADGANGVAAPDWSTGPLPEAAEAAWAVLGVASCATLAAVSCPTGFEAPTLRIPTLAATAPLAAVTKMAVAPAKVSARCLFMALTVETAPPTQPSRMVKNWQSPAAEGPETRIFLPSARVSTANPCHP